jgi:hypothetical protein
MEYFMPPPDPPTDSHEKYQHYQYGAGYDAVPHANVSWGHCCQFASHVVGCHNIVFSLGSSLRYSLLLYMINSAYTTQIITQTSKEIMIMTFQILTTRQSGKRGTSLMVIILRRTNIILR